MAIKFNEDVYFSNDFYSKVGGIPLSELDDLEYHFLILTNFNIYVSPELYQKYYESFVNCYTNQEEESEEEEDELLSFHKSAPTPTKKTKTNKKSSYEKRHSDVGKKPTNKKGGGNIKKHKRSNS